MITPREWAIPQIICAALGLVLVAGVLFAMLTSATAFGAYNYDWDGSADLREVGAEENREVMIVQSMSAYQQETREDTLTVILGPDETYTPESASQIRSYVRDGGSVLIATDFDPAGNTLLEALNTSLRIDGELVRDERNYGPSPAFPLAGNVSLQSDQASSLALNYGSVLTGVESDSVTVLAQTSSYAYLDENRNGELDNSEQLQTYPIIAREQVGNGSVIAVSDPSMFINTMLDREDNRAAARALFAPYEQVRFDYTHTGGVPPLVKAILFIRSSQVVGFAFAIGILGVTMGLFRVSPRLFDQYQQRQDTTSKRGLTEAEIIEVITDTHPEWEQDRVQRLASRLASQDEED
ncbi:DUF4350 domain-containing protein [Halosegnis longus]|uniref:DUF4350 domain-containing protein n=1 Tax=Halosegnis longus TaxID=2216012 RepID=UPI00096A263A|nr:DUF4350 domain-containing protein [Salella cibi]